VGSEGESLQDRLPILVELVTILCTLLCLDLGKVYLSEYIGRKLSESVYALVNRYFGVILSGIGLYFAYHFVLLLTTWIQVAKPH
jgi:threonine/homoserine/homoserine lactone efflux protein